MRRQRRWAVPGVLLTLVLAVPAQAAEPPTGPAAPVLAATPVSGSTAPVPTTAGLRSAALPALRPSTMKARGVVVLDPASGDELLAVGADRPLIPASTLKLLTTTAALAVLGPQARIETRVLADDPTAKVVTLTLVGGGDATLTRERTGPWASLADLASQVADAVPVGDVVVQYDASAFTGPVLGPGWPSTFPRAGIVAPVTALMVDEGRVSPRAKARVANPAKQAAGVFAALLRDRGLNVKAVRAGAAAGEASTVGTVSSPPIATLVQRTLTDSDNDLAEALGHLVGGKRLQQPSFAGGAKAVSEVVTELGLPVDGLHLVDGSGLSGQDRLTARTIAAALSRAAEGSDAGASIINPGLAVAGFTGTLADRFTKPSTSAADGVVRGKTGTLTGVSALAGTVRTADGRVLAFAVLGNKVGSATKARNALDGFAAQLAECGCR